MAIPGVPVPKSQLSASASSLLDFLRSAGAENASLHLPNPLPQLWNETVELALRHQVAPLLHGALKSSGGLAALPAPLGARLEAARRATALGNLGNYGELRRVACALRARGIALIALKGLHLAELVYRDISLRPMADLDLLVPRTRRDDAIAVLLADGYGFEEQKLQQGVADRSLSAVGALLAGKYHVAMVRPGGGPTVEIHWGLADPLRPYSPPIEEIWSSAVSARLGDVDVLVMSAEFLLLHVCAHLAYNHVFAFGLRGLCDIAEILRVCPGIDWNALAARARCHGWQTGVAAALRLARDHLGAPVPPGAMAAVGGDVLDAEMLAEAFVQLLELDEIPDALREAPNLVVLAGRRGLGAKIALAWKRLFVPRAELALMYGISQNAASIALFYAVRLRDLVRTYAASVWAFSVSDPKLAATLARQARLAKWIGNP